MNGKKIMEKFEPAARAIRRMEAVSKNLSNKMQEKYVEDNWKEMQKELLQKYS